jgi:maltose O-acetyltransferase
MLILGERYENRKLVERFAICGENFKFQNPIYISGAESMKIGNNVSMAAFIHIWGEGGIEIGNNTLIASHVAITSLTHDTESKLFLDSLISKPVIIGENVWIGSHAIILPGIKIADGAIVGAGAVVTKDVEKNTIVAGVPAVVIRYRHPDLVS